MSDYDFGNYLTQLRTDCGYTQFRLSRLLGVSDKAISKWENGKSRPRYETCERLAKLYHISVNDLLHGRKRGDGEPDDETVLWNKCRDRLHELYGETPPPAFSVRLEAERTAFGGKGLISLLDLLGTVAAEYPELRVDWDTPAASSFAAWLLGATHVNPMKPHTYCPKCKKVIFHPEVKDGWDLPGEVCACGGKLYRDGHDIPFTAVLNCFEMTERFGAYVSFDIRSDDYAAFIRAVEAYLEKHGKKTAEWATVESETLMNAEGIRTMHQFAILAPGEAGDFHAAYPNVITSLDEYWGNGIEGYLGFSVDCYDGKDIEPVGSKAWQRFLTDGDLFAERGSEPFRHIGGFDFERLSAYVLAEPFDISLCLVLLAYVHQNGCSITMDDVEIDMMSITEPELKKGTVTLRDIPSGTEQIRERVMEKMQSHFWFEPEFADRVYRDIDGLEYIAGGMDEDTKAALRELGFEDWYIDLMCYVTPLRKERMIKELVRLYR